MLHGQRRAQVSEPQALLQRPPGQRAHDEPGPEHVARTGGVHGINHDAFHLGFLTRGLVNRDRLRGPSVTTATGTCSASAATASAGLPVRVYAIASIAFGMNA